MTTMLDPRADDPAVDPFERFAILFDAALRLDRALLPEPTAFALATVGEDLQPSVRILLLKAVEAGSFVFYTNYESRKSEELRAAGKAAICFHWQHLERQVRAEGSVERVSDAEADAYFATRARGSQLGAWASRQSRPMEHDGALEERLDEYERRFAGADVPRPPHWGGWRLVPHRIEFWRNMPSRLHVRHRYERDGDGWRMARLYP
jgi:pyridoxamine 5'-phosphate oxidase